MDEEKDKSELPSIQESKKEDKKKKKLSVFLTVFNIVLLTLVVISIFPVATLVYRNVAFGDAFFINGMSMYPTLNKNSVSSSGTAKNWYSGSSSHEGDLIDYGWGKSDKRDAWLPSLKRFDIVYTYYPTDYTGGVLRKSAELKIKRIIGLPGETVTIVNDPLLNEEIKGNSVWGKTTIKTALGETIVLDNLYTEEDYPDIVSSSGSVLKYTSFAFRYPMSTATLGDGEYYLVGDNRRAGFSNDSRAEGPIKDWMIQGKACLITGMRELVLEGDSFKTKFRLDKIRMPWDYINLEH